MIVKNEAHVIRRCLDSVRPIIDHWIVVDPRSTDGTQDIIRAAMADLPGSLVERPWVGFTTNRNEALKLARRHADSVLIIDAERVGEPADMVLRFYERAISVRPAPAEARHGASRYCRARQRYAEGDRYAEAGLGLKLPSEGISLNPWVYDYGLLDEFAVNAYHIG